MVSANRKRCVLSGLPWDALLPTEIRSGMEATLSVRSSIDIASNSRRERGCGMIVSLESTTLTISLVRLSREMDKLSADLPRYNNRIVPTIEFLQDVVKWMHKQGLVDATPTAAWHLWKAVQETSSRARVSEEPSAEVAYWYGIDPHTISEATQLGLLENLPKLIAQERIYHGNYSPSDPRGVYALFMAAFDDENVARKAQLDAAKALVDTATQTRRLN